MSVQTATRPWERSKTTLATIAPVSNMASAIDELGKLREQLKGLETREKFLVALIKEQGAGEHAGVLCKAVVSISQTSRLDTTAMKETLPEAMIKKFTKTSDVVKVTIKPNL